MHWLNFYLTGVLFQIALCWGGKILLAPFPYASHVSELLHIGEELNERGHEIHLLLPETYPKLADLKSKEYLKFKIYTGTHKDMYVLPESEVNTTLWIGVPEITDFRTNVIGFGEFCYNALEDTKLYDDVRLESYDLAIVDGFPCSRCYYILFYRLGISYVSVTTQHEPWIYRSPAIPSFVPFGMSTPPKSQNMTFWEKLDNLYSLLDWSAFPGIPYMEDSLVAKYAPEKQHVSLNFLAAQSLLWLIDTDIAVDYPRPLMPNEINIGGLSTKPPSKLSGEFEKIVSKSKEGVIVASFGSLDILTSDIFRRFVAAFANIKQTVIMRYSKKIDPDITLPSNMNLFHWIPQNDLLGHRKTKLFISHGGANSQFEALYQGVPLIIFPLFADQPYNAKRGEYRGHSITMDILNFEPSELVDNVERIVRNESSYKKAIMKDSQIFRSRLLNPRERAAYWVEHVMLFGGQHLRSFALDIPWYEYLLLDIILFLSMCLLTIGLVFYFFIRFMLFKKRKEKIN